MHVIGILPADVAAAVADVSRRRYGGNVYAFNCRPDGRVRRPGTRFLLRPEDSRGPGSRYADGDSGAGRLNYGRPSVRAVSACSWDAHGWVLAETLARHPDAEIRTAVATYRGASDFHGQTGGRFRESRVCTVCAASGGRFRWAETDGRCAEHSAPDAPTLSAAVRGEVLSAVLPSHDSETADAEVLR
jgi:hypothetical protein